MGEKTYGDDKYKQAMEMTGFEYQTVRDCKWVASKVELSERSDNLTWYHHRLVAKYPPEQQKFLLSKASELGLRTVKQFREQLPRLLLTLPENVHDSKQAMELTGFEYGTIGVYKHVASRIQFLIRINNLSFSHHRLVAKYAPEQTSLNFLFEKKI